MSKKTVFKYSSLGVIHEVHYYESEHYSIDDIEAKLRSQYPHVWRNDLDKKPGGGKAYQEFLYMPVPF